MPASTAAVRLVERLVDRLAQRHRGVVLVAAGDDELGGAARQRVDGAAQGLPHDDRAGPGVAGQRREPRRAAVDGSGGQPARRRRAWSRAR